MPASNEIQNQLKSIEALVHQIEKGNDPAFAATAKQLVQSLMEYHGAAVERMIEIIYESEGAGPSLIETLGKDESTRSLLLLYGLHPDPLETRVLQALETSRPYLKSHGGNVNLVRVDDSGTVTLRLEGSCGSCPSSSATLKQTVEEAIYNAAPDVAAIVVQGLPEEESPMIGFVPLGQLSQVASNGHDSKPERDSKTSQSVL